MRDGVAYQSVYGVTRRICQTLVAVVHEDVEPEASKDEFEALVRYLNWPVWKKQQVRSGGSRH